MNPKFDASGLGGTTEFRVGSVVKGDKIPPGTVLTLPRYFPVIGDTPPDFLVFGSFENGRFDLVQGVPAPTSVVGYLRDVSKIGEGDAAGRVALAAGRLGDADAAVRNDAFLELAKAADRDLFAAKAALRPDLLRRRLDDPATPPEQLGLLALLLGVAGGPGDVPRFERWLGGPAPLPDAVADNLGGILAGYVRLAPARAWPRVEAMLGEGGRPIGERLSAVGTARYFAADAASRPAAVACFRAVLRQGDLADMAAEELRLSKAWDAAPEVLAAYARPGSTPLTRRAVVRFALSCPLPAAKELVAAARAKEPKLVADVEEGLRLREGR